MGGKEIVALTFEPHQGLQHFFADFPWQLARAIVDRLDQLTRMDRQYRIELIWKANPEIVIG